MTDFLDKNKIFEAVANIVYKDDNYNLKQKKYYNICSKLINTIENNSNYNNYDEINEICIKKITDFFKSYLRKKKLVDTGPNNDAITKYENFTASSNNDNFSSFGNFYLSNNSENFSLTNSDTSFDPSSLSYGGTPDVDQHKLFLNGKFENETSRVTLLGPTDVYEPKRVTMDIGENIILDTNPWKAVIESIQIEKQEDPNNTNASKFWGSAFLFEIPWLSDHIHYKSNIDGFSGKLLVPNETYTTSIGEGAQAAVVNYKLKTNIVAILPPGTQIPRQFDIKLHILETPDASSVIQSYIRGTDQIKFHINLHIERKK